MWSWFLAAWVLWFFRLNPLSILIGLAAVYLIIQFGASK